MIKLNTPIFIWRVRIDKILYQIYAAVGGGTETIMKCKSRFALISKAETYNKPEMEFIDLDPNDVLTASDEDWGEWDPVIAKGGRI